LREIVIGTRSSNLALWQANFVKEEIEKKYTDIKVLLKMMKTKGDKILDAPLSKIGGKGLFTKELEETIINKEVDIAVHSLKDMPTELPKGLEIAAITKRQDPGDAFVSDKYESFDKLPKGAKIGTSSLRRRAQLLNKREDLKIFDLRGNVETRLRKMREEDFDAVILAVAGLKRLGFQDKIREIVSIETMLPAVGQGALAIETRENDDEIKEIIAFLNDNDTRIATSAERAFLERVEGGCQVPVGVYGEIFGDTLKLAGVIASLDGKRLYRKEIETDVKNAKSAGKNLAEDLLNMGGQKILEEIGIM